MPGAVLSSTRTSLATAAVLPAESFAATERCMTVPGAASVGTATEKVEINVFTDALVLVDV